MATTVSLVYEITAPPMVSHYTVRANRVLRSGASTAYKGPHRGVPTAIPLTVLIMIIIHIQNHIHWQEYDAGAATAATTTTTVPHQSRCGWPMSIDSDGRVGGSQPLSSPDAASWLYSLPRQTVVRPPGRVLTGLFWSNEYIRSGTWTRSPRLLHPILALV